MKYRKIPPPVNYEIKMYFFALYSIIKTNQSIFRRVFERFALVILMVLTAVSVEDIMEKGFMLAVMCKPAAWAELANTAAAPKLPHIRALRHQTCTAVLALPPELQVPSSSSHHQLLLRTCG